MKLEEIFPRFPETGTEVEFLGRTFVFKNNLWTYEENQELDWPNNWTATFHSMQIIFFKKSDFAWDDVKSIV